MTIGELARLRLRNQRLAGNPLTTPAEAAAWLGAAQAQDLALARWSLGQRTKRATDAAVAAALDDGHILRTHVLRPTWHFVAPADLRWLTELTAPRVHALNAYHYRRLGADEAVVARSHGLLETALGPGRHLTRTELAAALRAGGIRAEKERLAYLLMRAELDLLITSGATRGKQATYALVAQRAPRAPARPREEALVELGRRYFTSHGPATVRDFAWWSSLAVAEINQALGALAKELASVEVDGRAYWFAEGAAAPRRTARPRVHLLQAYDEHVIAYSESKRVLDPAGLTRNADDRLFMHALVIDGQVAGRWRRTADARGATTIQLALGRALTAAEKEALAEEVERHGRFLERPARLAGRTRRA